VLKITLALIKLPPLYGGFSGATTKLTGPSTGCGIFSQEKPDLFAQIFLPWPLRVRTIRDKPAAEACTNAR
jgi:hypothetical protein